MTSAIVGAAINTMAATFLVGMNGFRISSPLSRTAMQEDSVVAYAVEVAGFCVGLHAVGHGRSRAVRSLQKLDHLIDQMLPRMVASRFETIGRRR